MGFIYCITCTTNNKKYIGCTKEPDPNIRWKRHLSAIKYGRGCPLLSKSVNKYGLDSLKFEVLIICFDEDLYKHEIEYIKKYNSLAPNGLNAHEGGETGGMFKGHKHSEETKRKIGLLTRERLKDPEYRKYVNDRKNENYIKNKVELDRKAVEARRRNLKLGITKYDPKQPKSEETKIKLSIALKKYYSNCNNNIDYSKIDYTKRNYVKHKISQYSLTGEYISSFNSIKEAALKTNLNRLGINAMLCGRSKSSGGVYLEV